MFKNTKSSYIGDKGIVEKSNAFDLHITVGCILLSLFFIALSIFTILYS